MFCPEGFHLIREIELMVENIAEEKLPWSPSEKAVNLAEKEQYFELDAYEIKWSHAKKHLQYRLIDNFLNVVENIWICPPRGSPLKFSKLVLLPTTLGFLNRGDIGVLRGDDYFTFRENEYSAVNTAHWVIDKNKSSRQTVDFSEFHGWSLCIKEVDFPKSEDKFLKSTGFSPLASEATSKGRPPKESKLAISLLKTHFPDGIGDLTVKKVMLKIDGHGRFNLKTLERAIKVHEDTILTK